jgi:hypothetical protein
MIARSAALISGVCERKDPLRPLVITQYYEKGSVLQMLARAKSWLDLAPPARKEVGAPSRNGPTAAVWSCGRRRGWR